MQSDYKLTLNLPRTDFAMKANLPQKEEALLSRWGGADLYREIIGSGRGRPLYLLHDGPPYANGHIHIGHALNKILKDIIVKSRTMAGFASPYVPGWDCHGLPIEHQVLKELGPKKEGMSKSEIRRLCRKYAQKFIDIQREEFQRLGVFGDWENPYLTMRPGYEAEVVRQFGKAIAANAVYKGKKPVLWCPVDETALAEAEVEYAEQTSPSVYVKFPVVQSEGRFPEEASVVIWTTTPWTLVANQAISVHPRFVYRLVQTPAGELIIAQDLIEACMKTFGYKPADYKITEGAYAGQELVEDRPVLCRHPWLDRTIPVICGEHVTKDQGTGCVHTAPGHGQEDFEVGRRYGLGVYSPVDHQGRFTGEAGVFAGQKVLDANQAIIALLKERGALLKADTTTHSYPHCWRCKNPVLFRATEQWFISMGDDAEHSTESLRGRAVDAILKIGNAGGWIPPWGRDRILGMIQTRPDWCISRQRAWGVPIVAFTCLDCQEPLITQQVADHVADLMEREGGSDIWFAKPAGELLPTGTTCKKCGGSRLEKEDDILDVWFESGVSHAAILKKHPDLKWPADLYLEGSDQHRGWFHSALLTSLLSYGEAPYQAVLTHGFVVDGEGKKMSKSAGNVVAPQEIIQKYGAEILRLWVAATDFREDARISPDILAQLAEAYRKIRNTCRFLLSNLYDYDASRPTADGDLSDLDRYALSRLHRLIEKILRAYEEFEFHLVFHALTNFCANDLSSLYFDIQKDHLYTFAATSRERRAIQRVLAETVVSLAKLMAPILSFTAEEIWAHLPPGLAQISSVHLAPFPQADSRWMDPAFAARWERLLTVRAEATRELERARRAGMIAASLEAKVTLHAPSELLPFLKPHAELLAPLLIVSAVELKPTSRPALAVEVERAPGKKCARCWNTSESVGDLPDHPLLCSRCAPIVRV